MSDRRFSLPPMVDAYLATLNRLYDQTGDVLLRKVVVNGVVSIHEEWDYDNWDGGTYGHAVTLTIPEDLYLELFDKRGEVQDRIAADLNKLDNSRNEHISAVFVEMEPIEGDRWREESGILRQRMIPASIPAQALHRIWGTEHVRVFLSHKSSVKEQTSRLKQSFARCGISAFVAHNDIEPTEEWQREIERALFSMDALVALLTKDFHDSDWTDQEVGVAIGRGVPLIAVKLGRDPYGLMGKGQAISGCSWEDTDAIAAKIFRVLHKRLPDKSRLFECALSAYAASTGWGDSVWKIKNLLSPFESVTDDQASLVVNAYQTNPENRNSFDGMDALKPLLEKWTKSSWEIKDDELVRAGWNVNSTESDEVPF